jgi:hypothetical protein
MQKFIEESKEYKNLTKVGEEYQPYLRNINRESFDYQGINSVDGCISDVRYFQGKVFCNASFFVGFYQVFRKFFC